MAELWISPEWQAPPATSTTIVFVHGAVVNGWEMVLLRFRLRQLGYKTRLFQYHSMTVGLDENVKRLKTFITQTEGDVVHVIGHSMGGVLTRLAFERDPDPRPGRLIAVGSPFLDCWIGHRVICWGDWCSSLLGRTVYDHIRRSRDPVWRGGRDLGVLAGTYPFGIGRVFPDLPKPSDGVVLWEETRLQGLKDHVTYRINHFGLLLSQRCTAQMACFLATGAFAQLGSELVNLQPLHSHDLAPSTASG